MPRHRPEQICDTISTTDVTVCSFLAYTASCVPIARHLGGTDMMCLTYQASRCCVRPLVREEQRNARGRWGANCLIPRQVSGKRPRAGWRPAPLVSLAIDKASRCVPGQPASGAKRPSSHVPVSSLQVGPRTNHGLRVAVRSDEPRDVGSRLVVWSPESVAANWGLESADSRRRRVAACAEGRGDGGTPGTARCVTVTGTVLWHSAASRLSGTPIAVP